MAAYIKAISYFLPENTLSNKDLSEKFDNWEPEKIEKKIGVNTRHIVEKSETASDLAYHAAIKLINEYKIDKKSIDFIILCTQSPDYFLPTSACILQAKLGLPTSAGALDFNLGCSGCVYGLALAKGLISASIAKNVLLITAETYSKYIHPEDISNRSIFGDGAAACLVSENGFAEIGDFVLGTDGSGAENLIVKTGASRYPEKTGSSEVDEENHIRHDDFLYMNGGAIFNFTLNTIPDLIKDTLEKNHLNQDDISYYIFHQANKFMLNTIRKVAAIPPDKFYIDLLETGNTVSATILIALKKSIEAGRLKKGDKVMIAGFGVGLSWGATILSF